jgi:DNA-directed RNA polymerase
LTSHIAMERLQPKREVLDMLGGTLDGTAYGEQIEWEMRSRIEGRARYWQEVDKSLHRGDATRNAAVQGLVQLMVEQMQVWAEYLCRSAQEEKTYSGSEFANPVLEQVPASAVAAITVQTALELALEGERVIIGIKDAEGLEVRGETITKAVLSIGKALVAEAAKHSMSDDIAKERRIIAEKRRKAIADNRIYVQDDDEELTLIHDLFCASKVPFVDRLIRCAKKRGEVQAWYQQQFNPSFVRKVYATLGGICMKAMMKYVVLPVGDTHVPVFDRGRTPVGHSKFRSAYAFFLHQDVVRLVASEHGKRENLRPIHRPMLVPPMPWGEDGKTRGDFIATPTPIVSRCKPEQRRLLRKAQMPLVYRGRNAVNAQAFRIADFLIPMVREAMSRGMTIGNLPPAFPRDKPVRCESADIDEDVHKAWKREARAWYAEMHEMTGRQQIAANALDVAEDLVGRTFYHAHGQDFRGRYFTWSPHLSHYQFDAIRALHLMADDKPMTDSGTRWLAIHAANMFGMDKLPMVKRIEWTKANAGNIVRAVRHGLADEWWQQADKPWQFLVACHGLCDPKKIGRFVPITRDGTFNGLQHMAAITRDPYLARKSNLVEMTEADAPEDQYLEIGLRMAEILREQGHTAIAHFVNRKVAKPQVMLPIYGITAYGSRGNAMDSLVEQGCPRELAAQMRGVVAKAAEQAMGEQFGKAVELMDFLRQCASAVANTGNKVFYQTPLGWPVLEHYSRPSMRVCTVLGMLRFHAPEGDPPVVRKQASAAVPTFVHSVDQTHFTLAAIGCREQGLGFCGQHDAFCQQPADCDAANVIITDTFIETHNADPLGLFYEGCQQFTTDLPPMIARSTWNVSDAKKALYAFA